MNSEIYASFEKFIVTPNYLTGDKDILIILTDYSFWAQNQKEFEDWNLQLGNSYQMQGMTVLCTSDEALTTFILKWG